MEKKTHIRVSNPHFVDSCERTNLCYEMHIIPECCFLWLVACMDRLFVLRAGCVAKGSIGSTFCCYVIAIDVPRSSTSYECVRRRRRNKQEKKNWQREWQLMFPQKWHKTENAIVHCSGIMDSVYIHICMHLWVYCRYIFYLSVFCGSISEQLITRRCSLLYSSPPANYVCTMKHGKLLLLWYILCWMCSSLWSFTQNKRGEWMSRVRSKTEASAK